MGNVEKRMKNAMKMRDKGKGCGKRRSRRMKIKRKIR